MSCEGSIHTIGTVPGFPKRAVLPSRRFQSPYPLRKMRKTTNYILLKAFDRDWESARPMIHSPQRELAASTHWRLLPRRSGAQASRPRRSAWAKAGLRGPPFSDLPELRFGFSPPFRGCTVPLPAIDNNARPKLQLGDAPVFEAPASPGRLRPSHGPCQRRPVWARRPTQGAGAPSPRASLDRFAGSTRSHPRARAKAQNRTASSEIRLAPPRNRKKASSRPDSPEIRSEMPPLPVPLSLTLTLHLTLTLPTEEKLSPKRTNLL